MNPSLPLRSNEGERGGYHAIQLDSNEMIDQKIEYVHQNPIRALIVEQAEDYLFSSARNYSSLVGMIIIDNED